MGWCCAIYLTHVFGDLYELYALWWDLTSALQDGIRRILWNSTKMKTLLWAIVNFFGEIPPKWRHLWHCYEQLSIFLMRGWWEKSCWHHELNFGESNDNGNNEMSCAILTHFGKCPVILYKTVITHHTNNYQLRLDHQVFTSQHGCAVILQQAFFIPPYNSFLTSYCAMKKQLHGPTANHHLRSLNDVSIISS